MITVTVCTYNQEKYLAQALDSILMQKCTEPYEILIGDDCSTDGTSKIADEYQARYPNIVHVIRPPHNLGASENGLQLAKVAKGDYFMVCDGDDYWLRDDMMQRYYDIFTQHPEVGMICAKAKCYYQQKGAYGGTLGYAGVEDLMTMLRDNQDVAAPTIAFRRDLMLKCISECEWYIKHNCFYDSVEAYWFAYNSKIKFIDEEMSAYRVLANSASHATDNAKGAEYDRRYFAVKWHFVMTHPDLCNEDMYRILMKDYDERTARTQYWTELKKNTSKAYRVGNAIVNLFKKLKSKH